MFDAVTQVPPPVNEPIHTFPPGSPERAALEARLKQVAAESVELSMTIGGEQRAGGGEAIDVIQPHRRDAVLGTMHNATPDDEAIRRLLAAGLKDVAADHGLGQTPTYSSIQPTQRIDYIFSSSDIQSLAASIPPTSASDHSPVAAVVRLP